jgi:serine/threonine protein kinase
MAAQGDGRLNVRAQELFHELADLSSEARGRYFAEHDVDYDIRREVEVLLEFDSGASAFLQRGVGLAASSALPKSDLKGQRCGPYRLLDLIGRGGMGAVYLAERADGEVSQTIAVKLLAAGAGDAHLQRFLQERQILAALSHANIARLLDAGHLDNGQPFLAMEYVEGKPIDVFAAGLSLRQKIALFIKVCAVTGYLHRNLVVHRDLKPSNILVTASGEPKLLDFGISKILDLTTDSTRTSMRMLTPDYASPEQVTGGRVSTATDIYSLGAVLYLLLTDKPPHEFEGHEDESIASVITTRQAVRPSKWAPDLKGDLDFILLKALRKDPQERYETVEQFAADLQAFLESRPVKARSGNTWYRARKFLVRYWVPVTAAALAIASLSAGLIVANRQRAVAERRFTQLRQLARQVIFDIDKDLWSVPGSLNARKKLVSTSTQYLEGLGMEALQDRDLALEVGEAYLQIARIQGVPAWNNLGQYSDAGKNLETANRFIESVLAADPGNRKALWLSANVAHDSSFVAYALHLPEQVLEGGRRVVERFHRLAGLGNLTRQEINAETYMYGDLAETQIGLHRFQDATRYARLGIEISRNTPTIPGPQGQAFNMLAGALMDSGDFQGALEAVRKARELWEKLRHDEGDTTYTRLILYQTRCREGLILGGDAGINLNRPLEAIAVFRQAFDAVEENAGQEKTDYMSRCYLATAGRYLGNVLRHGDPKQALEVYDHSLMRIREVKNDVSARREEAALLACSSYAARWRHRAKDAGARIDEAFRLLRETKDYPAETIQPGSEAASALQALASQYAETGQLDKAVEVYQELRRKIATAQPDPRNDLLNAAYVSNVEASFAMLLRRTGRTGEAVTLDESRLALWRYWNSKLPRNPFVHRQLITESTR